MRTNKPQYVIDPPDIPIWMYRDKKGAWDKLVQWSHDEFQARLRYLTEHGYWLELKKFNSEWSPMRILAELSGFRRMCAYLSPYVYDQFTARQRVFIRRAFELRDFILRQV